LERVHKEHLGRLLSQQAKTSSMVKKMGLAGAALAAALGASGYAGYRVKARRRQQGGKRRRRQKGSGIWFGADNLPSEHYLKGYSTHFVPT